MAVPALAETELAYPAHYTRHWKPRGRAVAGTLAIEDKGIAFRPEDRRAKGFFWPYLEIQQLSLGAHAATVLTYEGRKWELGKDRAVRFEFDSERSPAEARERLRARLGQRFVDEIPRPAGAALAEFPAKHLRAIDGTQGTLRFGKDLVVYETGASGDSRTWRYEDIDNISSSGPYDLTIATFERSGVHYGSRKEFHFQLKAPLAEEQFDALWNRLHRDRIRDVLRSYAERMP